MLFSIFILGRFHMNRQVYIARIVSTGNFVIATLVRQYDEFVSLFGDEKIE